LPDTTVHTHFEIDGGSVLPKRLPNCIARHQLTAAGEKQPQQSGWLYLQTYAESGFASSSVEA
jgi:hypothetical protein